LQLENRSSRTFPSRTFLGWHFRRRPLHGHLARVSCVLIDNTVSHQWWSPPVVVGGLCLQGSEWPPTSHVILYVSNTALKHERLFKYCSGFYYLHRFHVYFQTDGVAQLLERRSINETFVRLPMRQRVTVSKVEKTLNAVSHLGAKQ